jgi:hypothetical protein
MVCAVLSASITPECIEKVQAVRLVPRVADNVQLGEVADLISASIIGLSGIVIAERGDLYNMDVWRVSSILGRDFKYPESLGERTAIELAHHVSLAGRKLLMGAEGATQGQRLV